MSRRKVHESNENLEKCDKIVQQSGTKGISASDVAIKLNRDRSRAYDYLNSLELRERVYSSHGLWFSKREPPTTTENLSTTEQPSDHRLEKEIVIELPLPKDKWYNLAVIEAHAKLAETHGYSRLAETEKIFVEKFNETRRIKITAKNVNDIELEKLTNLIQQANEKSSKMNLKKFFKNSLKREQTETKQK